jgi:hypothetical protein
LFWPQIGFGWFVLIFDLPNEFLHCPPAEQMNTFASLLLLLAIGIPSASLCLSGFFPLLVMARATLLDFIVARPTALLIASGDFRFFPSKWE